MDIIQWLKDTAAATRPTLPKPAAHLPEVVEDPVQSTSPHPRKVCQRLGADSSILTPEHTPSKVAHVKHSQGAKLARRASSASLDSHRIPPDGTVSTHSNIKSAGLYQRRKRCKPRPNKYDLKVERTREVKEPSKRSKAKKPNLRKDKKKRSNDKLVAPVVRGFHAPNVLRERLTLPTVFNPGLFKKGKASSPFKGRGPPDLAFSEKRFLQKRTDLHDAAILAGKGKSKLRKGRSAQIEEEISAYFGGTRPPSVEKNVGDPFNRLFTRFDHEARAQRKDLRGDVSESNLGHVQVEQIEGKVARATSPCLKETSTTYFSWSTSLNTGTGIAPRQARHRDSFPLSASDLHVDGRQDGAQRTCCALLGGSNLQGSSEPGHEHSKQSSLNEQHATRADRVTGDTQERERYEKQNVERIGSAATLQTQSALGTEILALPSSPPGLEALGDMASEGVGSNQKGVITSGPSGLDLKKSSSDRSSSSTSIGELLKDCDAVFAKPSSLEVLSDAEDEHCGYQSLSGRDYSEQTSLRHADGVNPVHEDLRRSWRITNENVTIRDASRPELWEHMSIGSGGYSYLHEEGLAAGLQEEQAACGRSSLSVEGLHGDKTVGIEVADTACLAADWAASIRHGGEEQDGDDGDATLDGFWRPNILY
ncbi:uncharacterized protein PV09_01560 [Verruconis gallopava]|uniref:Uncharacterized protein n=1 Tax=Verruconis gallopava TaxID=253628 RepID=A0A0D2AMC0_9PEZI|nr:uncharacterized protein PV09_01560 [Verruconis gallopava]KIW07610.1 hypothetical protein PV09_01560 [Verruconis gallopava]